MLLIDFLQGLFGDDDLLDSLFDDESKCFDPNIAVILLLQKGLMRV